VQDVLIEAVGLGENRRRVVDPRLGEIVCRDPALAHVGRALIGGRIDDHARRADREHDRRCECQDEGEAALVFQLPQSVLHVPPFRS
jgi:hypothetical protein